jgi:ABC-type transporter Mla MlaB component
MLAWKRHARQRAAEIKFQGLPVNLTRMIQLYGVAEFL